MRSWFENHGKTWDFLLVLAGVFLSLIVADFTPLAASDWPMRLPLLSQDDRVERFMKGYWKHQQGATRWDEVKSDYAGPLLREGRMSFTNARAAGGSVLMVHPLVTIRDLSFAAATVTVDGTTIIRERTCTTLHGDLQLKRFRGHGERTALVPWGGRWAIVRRTVTEGPAEHDEDCPAARLRRVERQIRVVEVLPHDAGDDDLRPTGAVVGGTRYLLDDDAFNTAWRGDVPAVQKYSFALRLGQPQWIVRIDLRIGVRHAGTVEWLAFSRPTSIRVYAGAGATRSPDQRVTWHLDPDDDHWQRLRWHFPVQTDFIQFYVQDATQCPFPGATISGLRVYGTAGNRVEPRELAKVRDWVDGKHGKPGHEGLAPALDTSGGGRCAHPQSTSPRPTPTASATPTPTATPTASPTVASPTATAPPK